MHPVLLIIFTLCPTIMVTSPFLTCLQISSSISRKQLSRLEIPSAQLSMHGWSMIKVVPFSVMLDFLPLFPPVVVKTTFLCNEALLNHPTGKTVSRQSLSPGPRLSGNAGRWLQCTLPREQHQASTWSKAKQISGV